MSRMKDYLFEINHPITWVKGEGGGLPRSYTLGRGSRRIIFKPQGNQILTIADGVEILLPIDKARFVYRMHVLYGWQKS